MRARSSRCCRSDSSNSINDLDPILAFPALAHLAIGSQNPPLECDAQAHAAKNSEAPLFACADIYGAAEPLAWGLLIYADCRIVGTTLEIDPDDMRHVYKYDAEGHMPVRIERLSPMARTDRVLDLLDVLRVSDLMTVEAPADELGVSRRTTSHAVAQFDRMTADC